MPGAAVSWLRRALAWLLAAVLCAVGVAWWAARPATPDAFYAPPGTLPGQPGVLLRQQPFERMVPSEAQGWRILYTTTRAAGAPAVASAIVLVPRARSDAARPVVAWTHGTLGVVPGCAPSLLDKPFDHVPALRELLAQGWIFVATDYVGLGTAGPHPYLIGEGEARSTLDAVRAARQMEGLQAGPRSVVWGHSQGGHAALWTGIVAPLYAPELEIAGVAAIAPASDLRPLIDRVQHTPIGRIMSSFVLRAYGDAYPDVTWPAYVPAWMRPFATDMAGRCLAGRAALLSAAQALALGGTIFRVPASGGALGERLALNTPDRPLPQPLLIAQGLADELVLPEIQVRFVSARCRAGQALQFRRYAGRDHLSVVAPDSPLTGDLIRWTHDRLGGVPPSAGCEDELR